MIAANGCQPRLEPVLYVEEKSYEIVENLRSKRRKFATKKLKKKKKITSKRKIVALEEIAQPQTDIKLESETSLHTGDEEENIKYNTNDPLFTPEMLVKCELSREKLEPVIQGEEEIVEIFKSNEHKDFSLEECTEDDEDEFDQEEEESEDNDSEDEEPLIFLRKKSTRGPYKKSKTPSLKACLQKCKFNCNTKFNNQQRLDIFHFYWQLSKGDQVNFIREHIRKQLSKRSRVTKVRHNCCYFLRNYKIESISVSNQSEEEEIQPIAKNDNIFSCDTEDFTKVCRTFFNGTLRISDQEIKEAFKDFELKPEKLMIPLRETDKIEPKLSSPIPKESKAIKLYLDPETGALTDTKPKKKTKPRKRGEPPRKRFPKPIRCAIRCKFKCHEKFSEEERSQICDVFWSLDFKRRKDFILSRIETEDVKAPTNPEFRKTNRPIRSYQTKFYLRSGPKSENLRVCKHFMENTLCVHPKFVDNAIKFSDKTTGAYTGTDRRGRKVPHNKTPIESKQTVLDHINSYPLWIPNKKSKIKYLHYSLAIRKMYNAYQKKCLAENIAPLTLRIYYKVFHEDFHLLFLSNPHPKKGRGFYKTNPNISHYTGDEAGGCWIDSKGLMLDLRFINPALALDTQQSHFLPNNSRNSLLTLNQFASGSTAQGLNLTYSPCSILPFVSEQPVVVSDMNHTNQANPTS